MDIAFLDFIRWAPSIIIGLVAVLFIVAFSRKVYVHRFFGVTATHRKVDFVLSNIHVKDVPAASDVIEACDRALVRRGYRGDAISEPDVEAMLIIRRGIDAASSEGVKFIIGLIPFQRIREQLEEFVQKLRAVHTSFRPCPLLRGKTESAPNAVQANTVLIGSSVYNSLTEHYLKKLGYAFTFHPSIEDPFAKAQGASTDAHSGNIRWVSKVDSSGGLHPIDFSLMKGVYAYDLGVVGRFTEGPCTIVICAGNDASSTVGCARYIENHLRDLLEHQGENFVTVLGFPLDQNERDSGRKRVRLDAAPQVFHRDRAP